MRLHPNLAMLLLRLPLGGLFLYAGLMKFIKVGYGNFVKGSAGSIPSYLPHALGMAYLYAVPFAEAIVGVLLIVGLMTRVAADKVRSLPGKPITEWPKAFLKNWDPKKDFAYAMLHAERLTKILADEVVAELLLKQARKDPARRDVLERWLDRAEPRSRFLADEITSTGDRLLATLAEPRTEAEQEVA